MVIMVHKYGVTDKPAMIPIGERPSKRGRIIDEFQSKTPLSTVAAITEPLTPKNHAFLSSIVPIRS